ncbi:hypothetical protein D3C77_677090 [compost metagenome]
MRQAHPGIGLAQGFDGLIQGWPVQFDVAQLAGAQPLAKRFAAVFDVACAHQKLGEVRACGCISTVSQLLLNSPCAL